jgi:hypothetical protein
MGVCHRNMKPRGHRVARDEMDTGADVVGGY